MTRFQENKLPAVFVWDNFGPMHNDRCSAVAQAANRPVIGIELYEGSDTYAWEAEAAEKFERITLFPESRRNQKWALFRQLVRTYRRIGRADWFMCHYERPEILLFAIFLRAMRQRVFTMGCSKFDDLPRRASREYLKTLWMTPYHGAIGSGDRSKDYLRFLGFDPSTIAGEYNTVSVARIKALAGCPPAPDGTGFEQRDFSIVARFVPKKNLLVAIEAFGIFARNSHRCRKLNLCGSGPLEPELRAKVAELGLVDRVIFHGFLQSHDIAKILGSSLALVLPSIEEQFGNVVIEAQAMGLPVILSDRCGARDHLVRSGQNGFIVEPDNPQGLAFFLGLLDRDEDLWKSMCFSAQSFSMKGDVARFADAVIQLTAT